MPPVLPRQPAVAAGAQRSPGRRPLHLIGLLAFVSGGVDAVTLMVIGESFTSVITGNLVFVGRAVGTLALSPALHAAFAVIGYIAGVAVGSRLGAILRQADARRDEARADEARRDAPAWPRRATIILAGEAAVLLGVNLAWIGYRAAPSAQAINVLLIALALALGMQGAAARAIAGTPSTTYMTGALTILIESLATGRRREADASAAAGLAALVIGAACDAALVVHAPRVALLPPLAAILLVIAVKARHHEAERRAVAPPHLAPPHPADDSAPG